MPVDIKNFVKKSKFSRIFVSLTVKLSLEVFIKIRMLVFMKSESSR